MTKITKLSLIAALTVAGTSACAQPLAEAIKNVDVSGTVAYRYNDYQEPATKNDSTTSNNYKIAVNAKSKVNDDITANVRFLMGADNSTGEASLDTQAGSDSNVDVELSEVNFTYTGLANTAITLGKQAINTPFTVARDSMGDEQTGTGILAQTNVGPVTLAGAYFNQTNFDNSGDISGLTVSGGGNIGSKDLIFVGALASFGGINLDASYVDLDDVFDAYTVGLNASYDVADFTLSPFARYTSLDLDNDTPDADNVLWKVGLNASIGIFDGYIIYGETDEEGGTTAVDISAETGLDPHWMVTLTGINDAEALYASLGAQVLPSVHLSVNYSGIDTGSKSISGDLEEVYGKVSYEMSKNFTTYVQFGQYTADDQNGNEIADSTIGRLHVEYSF